MPARQATAVARQGLLSSHAIALHQKGAALMMKERTLRIERQAFAVGGAVEAWHGDCLVNP
jgi:hypothetical protein